MTESQDRTYGAVPHWQPGRPKIKARRLLLQWATSAVALYVAAMIVPGVHIEGFGGALVAAALIAVLNALLPPLIAALRLPYMLAVGFLLVLLLDALMVLVGGGPLGPHLRGERLLLGPARRSGRRRRDGDAGGAARHQRRRRVLPPRHAAHRAPLAAADGYRRAGHHLPRDRRAGAPRAAARPARRPRAGDGALDRVRLPRSLRMGDRPQLADRRLPGRAAPGLQRRHPGVPLGREGDRGAS